jgi:hypothetical protein
MVAAKDIKRKMWSKSSVIALFVLLVSGRQPALGALTIATGKKSLSEVYSQLPLSFESNRGQTDGRVKYLARGQVYNLFLTSREAVLTLYLSAGARARSHSERRQQVEVESRRVALRLQFVDANLKTEVTGLDRLPGKSHYFVGKDPSRWTTNVPTYERVKYQELYPGVDLIYYGNQGRLEYDFVISPGADARAIRLKLSPVDDLRIDPQGMLVVQLGEATLRMHKPFIYQERHGARTRVEGGYVILGRDQVGFRLAAYDASRPLVIDPVLSLSYSTYLGGSSNDLVKPIDPVDLNRSGNAIAVDNLGDSYVIGSTFSNDFPLENAFQDFRVGLSDAFVAKLNSAGDALVYSTYLGGTRDDVGNAIAVDSLGNSYVIGSTLSDDFPLENAFQDIRVGLSDAFVAKLNSTGDALVFSTYLGGFSDDFGNAIAVDSSGNSYVIGSTFSNDFPLENAFQDIRGGLSDAFVSKLNIDGGALLYSTYLGGSSDDFGNSIAVDTTGNSCVTGTTRSGDFPTKDPLQARGSVQDGFVTKLNSEGDALVYSTYLGGSSDDYGSGIAVDGADNSYVVGTTLSDDFPVENPFRAFRAGFSDVFLSKLTAGGDALTYSTYLGGSSDDLGWGVAVDDNDNAFVTGSTSSNDFPVADPFQASRGGLRDAFVSKLNVAGDALVYSTYLGGSRDDVGNSIAVDSSRNSYVAGSTASVDFPVENAFQANRAGLSDVFVFKLEERETPEPTPPPPDGGDDCCDINCFIATAALGSSLEPQVQLLREFRDRFLLQSDLGRRLVNIYSTYSPPAAEFVARHNTLRLIVRVSLLPLVGVSWMALEIGPTLTLTLVCLFVAAMSTLILVSYRKWRIRAPRG